MIKLESHRCDTGVTFTVSFATEAQAVEYVQTHGATHAIRECEDAPLTVGTPFLLEALYPSCEHGLSATLCAGPNHYPADL